MGVTARMASREEIRVDLKLTGEDTTARGLKKVEKAADGAGDSVEKLGTKATKASKSTEKTGDDFKDAADDAGHLKREIDRLTASYKDLIGQFNETGDKSLLKSIRKDKRDLRQFESLAKEITPALPDVGKVGVQAGTSFAASFGKSAATGIEAGGPYVAAAVAGIAVASAPILGAAIAAAVVGGVGVGGIVGGIMLAANDPRVQSAGAQLGQELAAEFGESAEPFVGPILHGLARIRAEGKSTASDLAPVFAKLAPHIDTLVDGLIRAEQGIKRGVIGILGDEDTADTIDAIANGVADIGDAIGDFLDDMDPQAAEDFFTSVLASTADLIRALGMVVNVLSTVYEEVVIVADALGMLEPERVAGKFGEATPKIELFGKSAEEAAQEVEDLKRAIDELFNHTMNLEQAQVAAARGMKDLVKELKDGPRVIDLVSQAGIANREALDSQISAWNRVREAQIASGMPMEQANARFQAQIDTLTNLGHSLGFRGKDFDAFMAKWRAIPDVGVKTFIFKFENQAQTGSTAWSMLRAAERQGLEGRAGGGPTKGGKAYVVGENGPEIWAEGSNGHMFNAQQTQQMLSGQSGGVAMAGAGGTLQLEATARWVGGDGELMEALAKAIRIDVKVRGGGSVQNAYGENT